MHPRVRLTLGVLVACAAAALLAVAVAGSGGSSPAGDAGIQGRRPGFAGALLPAGLRVHDFSLRDQDGRRASLREYRGKVAVVTFLYTRCRDTCPLIADQIRGALDELGGAAVPTLAISVDPAHDTPDLARRFVLAHRLTGRMRFLLGSEGELQPIWRAYGIRPHRNGPNDHTAHVLLFDRRGRPRVGFPIDHLTPDGLAHDIRQLRAEPR